MTGNAIREALEPFVSALEDVSIGTPDTVALWEHPSALDITVGDLRRARIAYDAGGFGVKALEWEHHPQATGQVRAPSPWGTYRIIFFGDYALWGCKADGISLGNKAASIDEAKAAAQADFERRVLSCISTHTAAGAGPVGEAVAWREFVLSRIKALGEGDQYGLKSFAIAELQSILDHVAHPVEEPGEVERLTRENNRLTDAAVDAEAALAESEQNAQGLASDLAGTQAELAEARERLEKERDAGFNHGYLMAVANIINLHRETVVAADVLLQIDLTIDDAEAFELAEYDMEALNRLRAEPRAADFFKSQRRAGDAQEGGGMSRRGRPMREKLSAFGRMIYASGAGRFYHDGDSAGFVWRWWHPVSWLMAPLSLLLFILLAGIPTAWRDRHEVGLRMKPWFVENPERLEWDR